MVIVDIVRRIVFGSDPESLFMMGMGAIALVANVVCLLLIKKHKDGEVHMRASWIFSANDVIANMGVILGAYWCGVWGFVGPISQLISLLTLLF